MTVKNQAPALQELARQLDGELHYDHLLRVLYATDASVYRSLPTAVALPKHTEDIKVLIDFAQRTNTPLIPRTAGTSLAGQCVGEGIVVDVSKYMHQILEVNAEERWVRVQPGVIRDDLNRYLKPYGLFFGPNTSTSNRCMIGGMVGNNSSGTTSIQYGTTRDHVLSLHTLLSDGSEVVFEDLKGPAFAEKLKGDRLENKIYRHLVERLQEAEVQKEIVAEFPKAGIHRRNTGYAVDELLHLQPFKPDGPSFNLCRLLAGSEGTLAFTTEIKISVDPLPAPEAIVVAAHFNSIRESMDATLIAMRHQPSACELMDKIILDCTKDNREYQKNRFFVEDDPEAILCVELRSNDLDVTQKQAEALIAELKAAGLGYAFPMVKDKNIKAVWDLRKAGLGLLSNVPGDAKPVACIEDTAVALEDLPDYVSEFEQMMEEYGQRSVFYAHAGAGELHLRPILNLKKKKDRQLFYDITRTTAELVKKYRGSLSGEHGDGRVRAAFIPLMLGEKNYALLKEIKKTWDPQGVFNPGKITDAPPMNTSLRYEEEQATPAVATQFDYSEVGGILRAVEKCNGSGDCRKSAEAGGVMCPSYQATRNEKDTTRARANALREFLTQHQEEQQNPFNHPELKEVMDLCMSCKGCTSECPSNVDMSSIKAEFQYQYFKANGVPLRHRLFAENASLNSIGAKVSGLTNFAFSNRLTSAALKRFMGVHPKREIPRVARQTLRNWYKKQYPKLARAKKQRGQVWFFFDEYTNLLDAEIGIKAIELLHHLGYEVQGCAHAESGRSHLSKGLLDRAKKMAEQNVRTFADKVSYKIPLLGVEPSAILGFRDEYPRLVEADLRDQAKALGQNALMIEEFLKREMDAGRILPEDFRGKERHILLHGHCHQKALASVQDAAFLLGFPEGHTVEIIPSGCCGMAGSFGYEKEHYQVSMQVGELVLFPAIRRADEEAVIAAAGTSCRHQIHDGTQRQALHPVELLWELVV